MPKKRHNGQKAEIQNLTLALINNGVAMEEGGKRKTWTKHDIKQIYPLTPTQEDMFHAWYNDKNICAAGSAGTGKTFIALFLALNEIIEKRQNKIMIVRSAVPTKDLGFMPGSYEEKIALYELPYHDIMWEIVGKRSTYQDMKDARLIEFMTTSYIRGLTWDNAVVVVEEGQNMTLHEINSIMTRIGTNSRIIFTGDIKQSDLDGKRNGISGMHDALKVFEKMESFETFHFNKHDIVRSEFVKSWIIALEETV